MFIGIIHVHPQLRPFNHFSTNVSTEKKSEKGYMWGCGLCPHPHIYPFFLLAVVFSVDSTNIKHLVSRAGWINIDAALGSESVENYQWT
jgi:hypothetical protein